jgi:hypothetical protein
MSFLRGLQSTAISEVKSGAGKVEKTFLEFGINFYFIKRQGKMNATCNGHTAAHGS